ncbi:hypothetical protein KUTeg_024746 [Tegillarca granosa]|uniref:Microtubule-associated protein Jupiter n=1 Tax=Tegillarca granosa TaxID=220873 RepID=A0ABQ9E3V9_TEGGR|nr:hypothetical protein KUTeg_024746 [Tegillarca granosa]
MELSTHNPITGEANPGFENLDYIPDAQNTKSQKGRRNIGFYNAHQTIAYNPITGQPVGNQGAANGEGDTKKVHTSSRVLNPPGGKSTALW